MLAKSATMPAWMDGPVARQVARSDIWEQVCSYSVVAFYSSSVAVFSTAPPHRLVFSLNVTWPKEHQTIVRYRPDKCCPSTYRHCSPQGTVRLLLTAATLSDFHSTLPTWYGQYHNSQRHLQTSTRSTSKHVAGRTSIG